jgi:hypothetical protein
VKTADGSFHQCYNAQTVVYADHQVIVATDLTDVATTVAAPITMVERTVCNTGIAQGRVLADAGYTSAANCDAATAITAESSTECFISPGRSTHRDPIGVAPRGCTPKHYNA